MLQHFIPLMGFSSRLDFPAACTLLVVWRCDLPLRCVRFQTPFVDSHAMTDMRPGPPGPLEGPQGWEIYHQHSSSTTIEIYWEIYHNDMWYIMIYDYVIIWSYIILYNIIYLEIHEIYWQSDTGETSWKQKTEHLWEVLGLLACLRLAPGRSTAMMKGFEVLLLLVQLQFLLDILWYSWMHSEFSWSSYFLLTMS